MGNGDVIIPDATRRLSRVCPRNSKLESISSPPQRFEDYIRNQINGGRRTFAIIAECFKRWSYHVGFHICRMPDSGNVRHVVDSETAVSGMTACSGCLANFAHHPRPCHPRLDPGSRFFAKSARKRIGGVWGLSKVSP